MARDKHSYKWDGDSRDERPSEFAYSGYSTTTSSEFHGTTTQVRALRKRRAQSAGVRWPLLIAACLSALVLYGIVAHLRG
jgi:hypothetical protein